MNVTPMQFLFGVFVICGRLMMNATPGPVASIYFTLMVIGLVYATIEAIRQD